MSAHPPQVIGARGTKVAIEHRQQNPSPEIEYSIITIPDENDLGTGRFITLLKVNALSSAKAISSMIVNVPAFQISVNINPGIREIPVLLGRADGTDPISGRLFILPSTVIPQVPHEFVTKFENWQVTGLELDGQPLDEKESQEAEFRQFEIYAQEPELMSPKLFFEAHKKILEDLFGQQWFFRNGEKKLKHPAYSSWNLCLKLIGQDGIVKWPEDVQALPDIAKVILDNYFILQCSGGDISTLRLGSFANYGSQSVRRRLNSVIRTEDGFRSVMTELSYSAWHISKGYKVTAYEEEGYPDFQVLPEDGTLPLVTDCKHIQKDSSDRRFAKVINKANNQVKKLGIKCYGIAVIDITEKVTNPNAFSDEIPQSVLHIAEVVSNAIQKGNSSISAVLLLWDDYVVHGEPSTSPTSLFAYRRRSQILKHRDPVHKLPEEFQLFKFGNTITYKVFWSPRT